MKKIHTQLLLALSLGGLVLASSPALAQWQWIDHSGRKIYSDVAPPTSVPEENILTDGHGRRYVPRAPKAKAVAAPTYGFQETSAQTETTPSPAPQAKGKLSKEEELERALADERQRKIDAERAEQEAKRKQEDDKRMAENCKALRQNLATVNSGHRIATLNEKGERVIMDKAALDAQRAQITQQMRDNKCN